MKIKDLTGVYGAVQGLFWVGYSAIVGFASVYLTDAGFSSAEIGMILALGAGLSVLLQPVVAAYADRETSPSLRIIVSVMSVLTIGFVLVLPLLRASKIGTAVLYVICLAAMQTITPLIYSLGMESLNQGKKLTYNISRSCGSIGYAAGSYLFGFVASRIGAVMLPVCFIAASLALLAAVLIMPFEKRPAAQADAPAADSPIAFFRRYPRFGIVLLGGVLVFFGHMLINSFTLQVVQAKGGGSEEMGIGVAIATVAELPAMLLFGIMTRKVRVDFWFRITGVFFTLKTLGTWLIGGVTGFYLVQLLQLPAWALLSISSVYYINAIMDTRDAIKGQAYFTMCYTVANVLVSLVCGPIIDRSGVGTALGIATVLSAAGMVIMLFATQKTEKV